MADKDITIMQKDSAGKWNPVTIAGTAGSLLGINPSTQAPGLVAGNTVDASGRVTMPETTDPSAPASDKGVVYMRDSGGKTQLVARFPSGAVQQLAIEP